jgi:hypothetical protein
MQGSSLVSVTTDLNASSRPLRAGLLCRAEHFPISSLLITDAILPLMYCGEIS